MSGSISIVTTFSSAGLASSTCDDMPDPCPMTAAVFASGLNASGMIPDSIWVDALCVNGTRACPGATGFIHSGPSEASGLPFVASDRPPVDWIRRTLTLAVRPSW